LEDSYFQLTTKINLQRYIQIQTELYGEYL